MPAAIVGVSKFKRGEVQARIISRWDTKQQADKFVGSRAWRGRTQPQVVVFETEDELQERVQSFRRDPRQKPTFQQEKARGETVKPGDTAFELQKKKAEKALEEAKAQASIERQKDTLVKQRAQETARRIEERRKPTSSQEFASSLFERQGKTVRTENKRIIATDGERKTVIDLVSGRTANVPTNAKVNIREPLTKTLEVRQGELGVFDGTNRRIDSNNRNFLSNNQVVLERGKGSISKAKEEKGIFESKLKQIDRKSFDFERKKASSGVSQFERVQEFGRGVQSEFLLLGKFGKELATNTKETIKQTGLGIKEVGRRFVTGEGFPEIGKALRQRTEFSLGVTGAIVAQGVIGGAVIGKTVETAGRVPSTIRQRRPTSLKFSGQSTDDLLFGRLQQESKFQGKPVKGSLAVSKKTGEGTVQLVTDKELIFQKISKGEVETNVFKIKRDGDLKKIRTTRTEAQAPLDIDVKEIGRTQQVIAERAIPGEQASVQLSKEQITQRVEGSRIQPTRRRVQSVEFEGTFRTDVDVRAVASQKVIASERADLVADLDASKLNLENRVKSIDFVPAEFVFEPTKKAPDTRFFTVTKKGAAGGFTLESRPTITRGQRTTNIFDLTIEDTPRKLGKKAQFTTPESFVDSLKKPTKVEVKPTELEGALKLPSFNFSSKTVGKARPKIKRKARPIAKTNEESLVDLGIKADSKSISSVNRDFDLGQRSKSALDIGTKVDTKSEVDTETRLDTRSKLNTRSAVSTGVFRPQTPTIVPTKIRVVPPGTPFIPKIKPKIKSKSTNQKKPENQKVFKRAFAGSESLSVISLGKSAVGTELTQAQIAGKEAVSPFAIRKISKKKKKKR